MAIPLSLYIHFPWCVKKCPYCDFNSHALRDDLPEDVYVDRLIADLTQDLPRIWNRPLRSIFMGGGTPSLFSGAAIDRLMTTLRSLLPLHASLEVTMEANPGTVEHDHFSSYLAAGINRLSMGVQSFEPRHLKKLGRIHTADEAHNAVGIAKKAGFQNFNLDLMYGLPDQTVAEAELDLKTALSLAPTHLSYYHLTLEPNTFFYHERPTLPHEDAVITMQENSEKILAAQGFLHYEVSAFSLKNLNSQHNRNYWEFGDYLGIGAGAHSKITDFSTGLIHRFSKVKHPKDYLNPDKKCVSEESILKPHEVSFEFMLNALRLYEPIDFALFEERTFLKKEVILPVLEQAVSKGLIQMDGNSFETTELGKRFLNDVVEMFLG